MTRRTLYAVVHTDWHTPDLMSFEQLVQLRCDEGWEPIGGVMRHPEKAHFYQAMVKREPGR